MQLHPYGIRQEGRMRHLLFQVWNCKPLLYETTFYIGQHEEGAEPTTRAVRSTYYAVPIGTLVGLMERAGFTRVERLVGQFFQPVLVGRKPAAQPSLAGDEGRGIFRSSLRFGAAPFAPEA